MSITIAQQQAASSLRIMQLISVNVLTNIHGGTITYHPTYDSTKLVNNNYKLSTELYLQKLQIKNTPKPELNDCNLVTINNLEYHLLKQFDHNLNCIQYIFTFPLSQKYNPLHAHNFGNVIEWVNNQ